MVKYIDAAVSTAFCWHEDLHVSMLWCHRAFVSPVRIAFPSAVVGVAFFWIEGWDWDGLCLRCASENAGE